MIIFREQEENMHLSTHEEVDSGIRMVQEEMYVADHRNQTKV